MPDSVSTRWRVVALQALTLVLMSCQDPASAPEEPPGSSGKVTTRETSGQLVQVLAHPDDDILFMNPDLAAGIHNGQPTVSVYLTGGESSLPNPAEYVAQRQEGTRAAYAHMAGVPNEWRRQTIPAGEHRMVELDELNARPDVRVVFLNLPEDNNPAASGGKHALTRLYNGEPGPVNTLVPSSGIVREPVSYNRPDVIDALAQLFAFFRPTAIRAQDSQPDSRYQTQWGDFHDHPDHVMSARFTHEATQRYLAEHPDAQAALVQYRDYNVADAPTDISQADQARKKDYFSAYAQHDSEVNLGGSYKDWTEHSYYRWTRGGSWAGRDSQGRLHAFAVFGSRLAHWSREASGMWQAPEILPTPEPLRPSVTVLRDNAGRLVLVAQSMDGKHVLVKRQLADGSWPAQWDNAGNPRESQPGKDVSQTGVPTAVIDGDGQLVVLLKNPDGGVSARRQRSPGGWEDWTDLGGSDVQDGIAAVTDRHNVLHVFASSREQVLHWREQSPGSFEPARAPFRAIHPASAPAAVREPGGQVRVFVRTDDDGKLAAVDDANPFWWQEPQRLGNPGGMTAPVINAREGQTGPQSLVFVRNSAGGVSATRQDDGGAGWTDLGGPVLDQPTAVVEGNGSITLLATGTDGRLLVNQDTPARSGLDFHGWHLARP